MTLEPSTLKQLLELPVLKDTAVIGARRVIAARGRDEGKLALTLWVDQTAMLRNLEVNPAGEDEVADLFKALLKSMLRPAQATPSRPQRVFVGDQTVARELQRALAPAGVVVEVLRDAGAALDAMMAAMDSASQSALEGYLSQPGVTPDAVLDFFELAGEFFELAPWETISNRMLLVLEGLRPEPLYCTILGSESLEYGFALYPDLKGPRRLAQGKQPKDALFLTYSNLEECGTTIAAEIEDLGLPLCMDLDQVLRAPLLLQARRKQASNPLPTTAELELACEVMTVLVDSLETGTTTVQVRERTVRVRYEDLAELTARRKKASV